MRRGKSASGNRLPDRWTHYLPLGRRLPRTRFIAFKVPLQKRFELKLAPHERFSPDDLLRQVRDQKEDLGLIIDLTFTTRYYQPQELPHTLQYCKILTVGHEVPDNETIYHFKSVVKKFLAENQHNDKLIGVHCTHGLNRTGYLVCRYLIDVEGMDPNVAIELFNSCRGHSMERKNYIEDLRRGYRRRHFGPRTRQIPPRPPRPGQSLVPHYPAPPAFCPPFPPATGFIPQSFRPGPGVFYAPYQPPLLPPPPPVQLGPGFPVQNPHGQPKRKRNRKKGTSRQDR